MISCKHTTCQADNRTRFCDKQKHSIKNWYKKGWTIARITKKFDASYTTIHRIVSESFRKDQNNRSNKINQIRYTNDKKFREKNKKICREIMLNRYNSDPVYRKCKIQQVLKNHWKNKRQS